MTTPNVLTPIVSPQILATLVDAQLRYRVPTASRATPMGPTQSAAGNIGSTSGDVTSIVPTQSTVIRDAKRGYARITDESVEICIWSDHEEYANCRFRLWRWRTYVPLKCWFYVGVCSALQTTRSSSSSSSGISYAWKLFSLCSGFSSVSWLPCILFSCMSF